MIKLLELFVRYLFILTGALTIAQGLINDFLKVYPLPFNVKIVGTPSLIGVTFSALIYISLFKMPEVKRIIHEARSKQA